MVPNGPVFNLEQLELRLNGRKPGLLSDLTCYRARVPGGWLVSYHSSAGVGASFIPDPEHQWDGSTLDGAAGSLPIPVSEPVAE